MIPIYKNKPHEFFINKLLVEPLQEIEQYSIAIGSKKNIDVLFWSGAEPLLLWLVEDWVLSEKEDSFLLEKIRNTEKEINSRFICSETQFLIPKETVWNEKQGVRIKIKFSDRYAGNSYFLFFEIKKSNMN